MIFPCILHFFLRTRLANGLTKTVDALFHVICGATKQAKFIFLHWTETHLCKHTHTVEILTSHHTGPNNVFLFKTSQTFTESMQLVITNSHYIKLNLSVTFPKPGKRSNVLTFSCFPDCVIPAAG